VTFSFIEEHKGQWPVTLLCRILCVSTSGFYAWVARPPSEQERRREAILAEIRVIHAEVKQRYGSPRIHKELLARDVPCSVNTVATLMHEYDIRAKTARKFRHTTSSQHTRPVAENLLDRQFNPSKPNEVWLADITYIWTREGWLYLAAVENLYSRRVVGWSMAEHMESRLVVDALEMAISRRLPEEGLLAHSDRGSQYASEHYQTLLLKHGIDCSMSGKGQCGDNAPMESFFGSLKKEERVAGQKHQHRQPEEKPKRSASLAKVGGVFQGMAPVSKGGESTPGPTGPGTDAPSARQRPGYRLVGCSPTEPSAISPGGWRMPGEDLPDKTAKGPAGGAFRDAASATTGWRAPSQSVGGYRADSPSYGRDSSPLSRSVVWVRFGRKKP
jgi:putative transposase